MRRLAGPVRVAHIVSHPIQYFAPLYKAIAENEDIDLTVYFCSAASTGRYFDAGFGATVEWDVPLLDGYKFVFTKEARTRTIGGMGANWRLSLDVLGLVLKGRYDVVWIHGYNSVDAVVLAALQGLGHRVVLRDEQTLLTDRSRLKRAIKRLILPFLYKNVCGMYIGRASREYFIHYGTAPSKLFPAFYSLDNGWLQAQRSALSGRRSELRRQFGIEGDEPVVLFCGKLIDKKRPDLLLRAFAAVRARLKCHLLFVGDGPMRIALEQLGTSLGITDVHFAGFLNQSRIGEGYVASDMFVLPSAYDETWGLVVNEAMNFGLPIIVSSRVGCGPDLVHDGINGYIFETDNQIALTEAICKVLSVEGDGIVQFGKASSSIIEKYDVHQCARDIVSCCLQLGCKSEPADQ